ncbi:MAG: Zn finger domain-containing DnaJ-class molecular chaperone, partial [bacterium]
MSEIKESFVPKILSDYYLNSRTGILTLKQKSIAKTIHIESGNIVFATTNIETEQLGRRLLEWRLLTPEQLIATDKLAQENRRFGKSLVELGFFQAEELPELFYRQASRIIYSTFSWQHFDFRFTRCALPEYEVKNSISIPQTLLEGIRYLDDIDLIKEHLGDLTSPLKLSLPLAAIYQLIKPGSQETYLLDNLDNIVFKAEEILRLANIPEETIIKTLCTLNLLGMLKQSERPPSPGFMNAPMATIKPISTPNIFTPNNTNSPIPDNISENLVLDSRSVMVFCYEIETKLRSINTSASLYEVLEVGTHASPEEI